MAQYGMAWRGVEWCGVEWYDMMAAISSSSHKPRGSSELGEGSRG